MNEKISVIVPVYNCEEYIDRCIKSILNQSYDNIEVILVDDGSQDGSGEICDGYAQADKRVKTIHCLNSGAANARLRGVDASTGEYITFIDCDDWISGDMLEYLYTLIKSGEYEISACGYNAVFGEDEQCEQCEEVLTQLDYAGIAKGLYEYALWSMWAKLYKRELFSNLDGVDINLSVSEDLLTNYYLTKNVRKVIVSNQKKYFYFRHKGSIMARPIDFERVSNQLKAYKTIYDDFDRLSNAFCYQAANRLNNDFSLLNQIIAQNNDKELYELVRSDIKECYKYVFDSNNNYCFGFKHRLGVMLILHFPHLYNVMIKFLK